MNYLIIYTALKTVLIMQLLRAIKKTRRVAGLVN